MATGQRILVVSRSESALAVLKEQLPSEVQPLAIAVLSNERQGLRQVESAIREIQSVTEGTRPQNRRATILRIEKEIQGLREQVQVIDRGLEQIAQAHLSKAGPRSETPAELAKRIVSERDAHRWFVDRPARFASEIGIADLDVLAAGEARRRTGDLIDHFGVVLPSRPTCQTRSLSQNGTRISLPPGSTTRRRDQGPLARCTFHTKMQKKGCSLPKR